MITGIIMASGFSNRMGRDKLILEINGIPIIERVIKVVKKSTIDEIILVYREERIKEIGIKNTIKTIYNDKAELGQSESIKIGIKNSSLNSEGFMFFVGDQPFINTEIINRLIMAFKEGKYSIVVPEYNGKRGNPVIFSSKFKKELLEIKGDIGGRDIIKKRYNDVKIVSINDSIAGRDIDYWNEYIKWR